VVKRCGCLIDFFIGVHRVLYSRGDLNRQMTAQVNEFVWKPGRNGNIDFCGNFKRLSEKEPKTAALLLGHFEEE
jgi:hypothetical protein